MSGEELQFADNGVAASGGFREEDWDEAEQGPCEKLLGGFVGCCIGIVLFPVALIFLGLNEQNYVCTGKSITYTLEHSTAAVCNAAPTAGAVLFYSCAVDARTIPTWSTGNFVSGALLEADDSTKASWSTDAFSPTEFFEVDESTSLGWSPDAGSSTEIVQDSDDFMALRNNWTGIVSSRIVWYYGCEETSRTRKVDGKNVKEYSYAKKWMTAGSWKKPTQCSQATQNSKCGSRACDEPPNNLKPFSNTKYAPSIKAGIFTIRQTRLQTTMGLSAETKEQTDYSLNTCSSSPVIGCHRMEYFSGTAQFMSGFAKAKDRTGTLEGIPVPASWGCSASSYWPSVAGAAVSSKENLKKTLEDTNVTMVWVFRLLGMLLSILGIFLCLSPIAAAADVMGDFVNMVPCIGGFLEDAIEGVVSTVLCGISCGIGCSCSLLVIAILQLILRPLVGAVCLAAALLCMCCAYGVGKNAEKPRKRPKVQQNSMEMPPMQAPMYPQYGSWPLALTAPGQHQGAPMNHGGFPQYGQAQQQMGQPMMMPPGQYPSAQQQMGQPMMMPPGQYPSAPGQPPMMHPGQYQGAHMAPVQTPMMHPGQYQGAHMAPGQPPMMHPGQYQGQPQQHYQGHQMAPQGQHYQQNALMYAGGQQPHGHMPREHGPQKVVQQEAFLVTVPPGQGPGDIVTIQTQEGRPLAVPIPEGVNEGDQFEAVREVTSWRPPHGH